MKQIEILNLNEHSMISLKPFFDNRGSFCEMPVFKNFNVVQENVSVSRPGTIRGMHWQAGRYVQAKIVTCLYGDIIDVIVDIRPDSKTFKRVFCYTLGGKSGNYLYIPKGYAHGFINVGGTDAVFRYIVDNEYNKESERGFYYNSIEDFIWPKSAFGEVFVSDKDVALPSMNGIQDFTD